MASRTPRPPGRRDDDEPVLPTTTGDEQERGWGADAERSRRERADYDRERPPHHE